MKNLLLITVVVIVVLFPFSSVKSQTFNWQNMGNEKKHIASVNAGLEYGIVYGLAYNYAFKLFHLPVVTGIEYSIPSGKTIGDDFKTKTGLQVQWLNIHHFCLNTRAQAILRRYKNDFLTLTNAGSDLALTAGYYRSHWFLAAEAGFDKAIATHFKHSTAYRGNYAGALDGWYEPTTGGNVYFGAQTGVSVKQHEVFICAGKLYTQDLKSTPMIPFYARIGYTVKF